MRKIILITVFSAVLLTACVSRYEVAENMFSLNVSFTDLQWDGKNVPEGQQCRKFGGKKSATPELKVEGIPATADALVVEYNDLSYSPMSNGGHGIIGYEIETGATSTIIPSVPGHSFDLPEGFFLITAHQAPHWDEAGAYLPPCSGFGGLGSSYSATVKAIVKARTEGEKPLLLAEDVISMGKF